MTLLTQPHTFTYPRRDRAPRIHESSAGPAPAGSHLAMVKRLAGIAAMVTVFAAICGAIIALRVTLYLPHQLMH